MPGLMAARAEYGPQQILAGEFVSMDAFCCLICFSVHDF
jgi:hypothetical protein